MTALNIARPSSSVRTFFALIVGALIGFSVALLFLDSEFNFDVSSTEPSHIVFNNATDYKEPLYDKVKITCIVMTRPAMYEARAKHIQATWGKHCNKLLLFSTNESLDNNTVGAIRTPAPDGRKYLWQKAKGAFLKTYLDHFNESDWFYKADDDTFAIMENMRRMLQYYNPNEPLAFGYKFVLPKKKHIYFSGGPGYVMSRAALKNFVVKGVLGQECYKGNDGNEDVNVGKCLGTVGVKLIHSIDEKGKPNFSVFGPGTFLMNTNIPKWIFNYSPVDISRGMDCCPDFPIAFHYIKPPDLYTFYYLIYKVKVNMVSDPVLHDNNSTTESNKIQGNSKQLKNETVTMNLSTTLTTSKSTKNVTVKNS